MHVAVVNGSESTLSLRKSALLRAAADLFAAKGYHAVSTDDIGRAVDTVLAALRAAGVDGL